MKSFYQIVTKQEVDGAWAGFLTENSEIYKTREKAYEKAEELARLKTKGEFNNHLTVQHCFIDNTKVIEVFNNRIKDTEIEYHIKELTVTE